MKNTMAFVTSQFSCDRIIEAGRRIAESNNSEFVVVGIMDNEYEINPQAIEYLFKCSKENGATMRLFFKEDKISVMREVIGMYECHYVVSGMPSSNASVMYDLWDEFSESKLFYTVDGEGETNKALCKSKRMLQK